VTFYTVTSSFTCISCSNGYLSAYLRGQDITTTAADDEFCGQTLPGPLVTSNPRLLLVFNTTDARYSGRGFSAHYRFVTSTYDIIQAILLERHPIERIHPPILPLNRSSRKIVTIKQTPDNKPFHAEYTAVPTPNRKPNPNPNVM